MIADIVQDLRYGARILAKQSGYTLIIVLTLALGIGANTTMFSVLDGMLLKPLPGITNADKIVEIMRVNSGGRTGSVSYPDYRDYRDQNSTFSGIAVESENQFHLGTDKTAEHIILIPIPSSASRRNSTARAV